MQQLQRLIMEKNTCFSAEFAQFLQSLELINTKKIKLIIHVGTPKTGSTSLQAYLGKKQHKLRGKGILYPHNLEKISNPTAPKHQWFEKNLVTTHIRYLLENFKNIASQIKHDTHTIILSSEGIYNYWWDFPDQSKQVLSQLSSFFDTQVWVWFRDPLEFIESYSKQCVRNPRVEGNPCYGQDLSFSQMLDIEWFSRHLNYQGFVNDCQEVFGVNNVSAFEYQHDVVQQAIQKLGLATPYDNPTARLNDSLHSTSIELLRVLNQHNLQAKDKGSVMPHLRKIDEVLRRYDGEAIIDGESRDKVMKICKPIVF